MTVLQGHLCTEIEGQERTLTPADGEVCVEPWTHHRLIRTFPSDHDPSDNRSVFLLSAADTNRTFKLDQDFYENWYSYQEGVIVRGSKISFLQVLIVSITTATPGPALGPTPTCKIISLFFNSLRRLKF